MQRTLKNKSSTFEKSTIQKKDSTKGIYIQDNRKVQQSMPNIVQFGGSKWSSQEGREFIKEIGKRGGIALYLSKDAESMYVEAFREVDGKSKYGGAVQIVPSGIDVALHTRSMPGMEGGLGVVMMKEAMNVVAKRFSSFKFVQMTPAPGAASKKVIELLSEKIGTPEYHSNAKEIRNIRRDVLKRNPQVVTATVTSSEDRDERLQKWDPNVLPEHLEHLKAITTSDKTEGLQITGPAGGLVGFSEEATAKPEKHAEVISQGKNVSGYGIRIPMAKFLEIV